MPYESVAQLPASIKVLPAGAQSMFLSAYKAAVARGNGDDAAFKIAWAVVKKRFVKSGEEWVAKTEAFESITFYEFKTEQAESFVSRTEDGHVIHNYVLTDTLPDVMGTSPTEEVLVEWANHLSKSRLEVDTDHSLWDSVKSAFNGDVELVGKTMSGKKGIGKIVGAVVDAGRLVVSVMFDKRFERHIDRIKGMSIEAAVTKDAETGKWTGGRIFGATFAVNQNPANPRAVEIS